MSNTVMFNYAFVCECKMQWRI